MRTFRILALLALPLFTLSPAAEEARTLRIGVPRSSPPLSALPLL